MVSGIVKMILYPFDTATEASPIPVFPDVGSMMVLPFLSRPLASASSIIALAILSLTLPAGFRYSSLTKTLASRFSAASMFFTSSSGVPPISSVTFL